MIVLAALEAGPAHGYAVIERIRSRSGGGFDLPEGTIYPVLHRLEKTRMLESRWEISPVGRRRRVYCLTGRGATTLADRRALWRRFSSAIGAFLDEAKPCPA